MPPCGGRRTFTLRNDLSEIGRLAGELETFGAQARLAPAVIFAVNLALEEVITNAISYGFEDADEHLIEVELCMAERGVVVTVQDDGRPFDPLGAPEVDVTAPLEARTIGGLGVRLLRTLTDDITYTRADGKNVLVFEKRIDPPAPANIDG